MDDQEFYWDWIKHEDKLFVQRGSFFLVGEAMLFAAAAQLLAGKLFSTFLLLCFTGVLVSLIWFYANRLQLVKTMEDIKHRLETLEPRWWELAKYRRHDSFGPNRLMGYLLPLCLGAIWVAFAVIGRWCTP